MNIADQIADILAENPTGLKASEIASQIGCARKAVNSYLYAHTDMYEQHDGYIWTAKSAKRNAPPSTRTKEIVAHNSYSISVQQSVGNTFVSTLTITPNGTGYQISSTNNQIICCDCNKFVSVHAPACPFCGCPLHFMADTYYKRYGAEVIRNAHRQREEQQKAENLKRQQNEALIQRQVEQEYKHDVARECYSKNNNSSRNWKFFEKLCMLEVKAFRSSIARVKFLDENPDAYPCITDEQWFELITSDDLMYNQKLQKWAQEIEVMRKNNALLAEDVCKKNHVSEHITVFLSGGQYTADEVQARIDAARYFARTYPHLNLDEEQFMLLPVEEIKKRVNAMLKSFPRG